MIDMEKVDQLCQRWYDKRKYAHVHRVASIVAQDSIVPYLSQEDRNAVVAVALAHDLLEDTKCPVKELTRLGVDVDSVNLLTHLKNDCSYADYVLKIMQSGNMKAILVKTADMKDHLQQKATLSPKLAQKYAAVLPLFIRSESQTAI